MKEISQAEFLEKYGDVEVTFSRYYKYTFTYSAMLPDGKLLTVGFGGNHDDIYRHDVAAGKAEKVARLCPYTGTVFDEFDKVEGFYDY